MSTMTLGSKTLRNYLAAPSRVARKLDWQASMRPILAVDIGRDCIGLAVAPHPRSNHPIRTLPPVRLTHVRQGKSRILSQACVQTMASIVQEHQVCALLVSWPVQHEGRCGKPCGQVLHALDSLVQYSNQIVTDARPVCLWDDRHVQTHRTDEFGRDPLFGRNTVPANKTVHLASQEQYQHHDCSSRVAAQVWQDFCQTHWPQINAKRIVEYDIAEVKNNDDDLIQEEEEDLAVVASM